MRDVFSLRVHFTMHESYKSWIAANVEGTGYGKCHETCLAMQKDFPALRLRKGVVRCSWGLRAHWWLLGMHGEIVDPTARQFPDFPLSAEAYQDMTDWTDEQIADVVPSGVCMMCGSSVWHGANFCGSYCRQLFMTDLLRS